MFRSSIPLIPALLLATAFSASVRAEVTPASVVQSLFDADREFLSNATIRVEVTRTDSLSSATPGITLPRYTQTYTFGKKASVCVSRRPPLEPGMLLDPTCIRDGNDAVGVASGIVEVLTDETYTRAVSFEWVRYATGGRILEVVPGPTNEVDIYPATSPEARTGFYRPFLALGRGYSLFVDQVASTRETEAGNSVILEGTGFALKSARSVPVTMSLDPAKNYLVSRARFQGQANAIASTNQTDESGPLPLHAYGVLNTSAGSTSVSLKSYRKGVLRKLIQEAQDTLDDLPEGSVVFDHQTPDENGEPSRRVITQHEQ